MCGDAVSSVTLRLGNVLPGHSSQCSAPDIRYLVHGRWEVLHDGRAVPMTCRKASSCPISCLIRGLNRRSCMPVLA